MYKKADMFVYSGTGNTYKVAQCIGETAKDKGTEYVIRMIDTKSRPEEYKPSDSHLLGLLAPTIGAIQPLSFFRFILRLPKGHGQNVFLGATGAWTKIGPVFLPGYVGFGLYLAALFLLCKGYKVVGINGFGMAHNWTTLIPPYWKTLEKRINEEIKKPTNEFAQYILSGKRVYKRIGDLIFTLLIFPLPILFILAGHLILAKTIFAGSSCNGCGQCAKNCPRKAIKMYGGKSKRPYWTYKCEQCMRCAGFCPRKAVECNSLLFAALILLFFTVPINTLIIGIFNTIFAFSDLPGNIILLYILWYVFFLLSAAAIYGVFFLLNKIPFICRLFTCLSFTRFWRKYRHADISADMLAARH